MNIIIDGNLKENPKCEICQSNDDDVLNYGEVIKMDRFIVHHFCLLFSTNLPQNGAVTAGIKRFAIPDIEHLIKTSKSTICVYCDTPYATICCSNKECEKWYHLICGIKNKCQLEFCDSYSTYCNKHYTIKEKPYTDLNYYYCFICRCKMGPYHQINSIPSCTKCHRDWFHLKCLKPYAIHAGNFFKCLVCGNPDYINEARRRGIYIPDSVASWHAESEENYSKDGTYSCEADKCICEHGKEYNNENDWVMRKCESCAAFAIHEKCRSIQNETYFCKTCSPIINGANINTSKIERI